MWGQRVTDQIKQPQPLVVFDSMQGKKCSFEPLEPGRIRLYVCGITVYDYCHIGHARSLFVFDMIVRYCRFAGWDVQYVRNITDIDDKIIRRAAENDEVWTDLTARFIEAMQLDELALGIIPPDASPRATDYMPQMIELVEQLIAADVAYVAGNGDVCFSVERYEAYGALSHRCIDDMISGTRSVVSGEKNNPLDFVLWKSSKAGDPAWESPWGMGRPGWHLECSAMSTTLLGQPFDWHGGGLDLKFPHHENEIAQSQAVCNEKFARYWLHAGLLTIDGEKMSKSLNNFITIREALQKDEPELIRYLMLGSHYRSPVNFSEDQLSQAHRSVSRLYAAIRGLTLTTVDCFDAQWSEITAAFMAAMADDFNTPKALSVLFELSKKINTMKNKDEDKAGLYASLLRQLAGVLGLLQLSTDLWFAQSVVDDDLKEKIESLVQARIEARIGLDWPRADALRADLTALGVSVEDKGKDSTWRFEV